MKKIYILDAFHESGIALAKAHADVVCWPDPAIADWPEHADGVMVRMTPITAAQIARAKHVQVICKQGVAPTPSTSWPPSSMALPSRAHRVSTARPWQSWPLR